MKKLINLITISILSALLISGCAKAPTEEVTNAKFKVESVTNDDTQTYAAEELAQLSSDLDAALEEVNLQDEKWFGNFDKAKEMLSAIDTSAENVTAVAAQRKEEAKNAAVSAQNEALSAIENAKVLVDQAPTGKETKADIEMFKMDISGLEASLPEIQSSIDQEKYTEAAETARVIKEKAESISADISAALEKVKSKKK